MKMEPEGNRAGLYGNNVGSYPVKLVKFLSQRDNLGKVEEGLADFDHFANYSLKHEGKRVYDPILKGIDYTEIEPDEFFKIESVQSGGFIEIQYLGLVDEKYQVCANNRGSIL